MKVGWIGTGVMGKPMAGHLLAAGHEVVVYSRTRERASELLEAGAAWADSPAEVARTTELTCTMVGYPRDVEDVILGDHGVLSTARPGSFLVDFTTSSPDLARRIAEEASRRDVGVLDAPVSGGDIGARNATLSIMVGGERAVFDRLLPVLEALGQTVVYQGLPGRGQHTKMVNQIVVATNMIGVCEGLLYARRAGLDPETVLESVGGGAATSWSLQNLLPRILKGDLEPGFFVEHFVKDMGVALDECRRMDLDLPGLQLAHKLYQALMDMGHGRKGTQALILALEQLNAEGAG
jgi:3-hydroxyisobutyrate dehydrogenase